MCVLTLGAATLLSASDSFAIPSPDVIVNVFASAGQVLGLASVFFGAAVASKTKGRVAGGASGGSPILTWIFGLLFVAASIVCILQYSSSVDDFNRRMSINLTRPSTEDGRKVGDISLKTLSFSQQLTHPGALSTDRFIKEWKSPDFYDRNIFIDVRTPEEVEMGYPAGSINIPQPDLRDSLADFKSLGKSFLLFCDSGNRSGEICTDLIAEGVPCRFVVGGFEKWIAEGRPIENAQLGDGGTIRDIPAYPNKLTFLDTEQVREMVASDKALFIDVRYPGDYDLWHLPGALNIPIRKMRSEEMWRALEAVPHQPIITPCYDKRSCFFAMVVGLRMSRLGYDYRGRYTVPHEFTTPSKELDFILRWREENEKTLFGIMSEPLVSLLQWLNVQTKNPLLAILLCVLMLRLIFLPAAVKSDRDQLTLRALKDDLDALKIKTDGDPGRHMRAVRQIYRDRRITPGVNLIGSLLQMWAYILAFMAVQSFTLEIKEIPFLWSSSIILPDPYHVLPILVATVFFCFMHMTAVRKTALFTAMRLGLALFLLGVVWWLSIALNFYLVCSLIFMFVQRCAVQWIFFHKKSGAAASSEMAAVRSPVVQLRQAHLASGAGNKAARLARMMEAGLPVPDGFVITDGVFQNGSTQMSDQNRNEVQAMYRRLGMGKVAVRSSGLNEDGAKQSFAGVFDSLLNIEHDQFAEAVTKVRLSLHSDRVSAYTGNGHESGGILVQSMVQAEYAGVLFTEHPAESGAILIELTSGLGDALVSGEANSSAFRFGRLSGKLLDRESRPPIALDRLVSLGREVEQLFGGPQDIEWVYKAGDFYLIQARDITRHSRNAAIGSENSLLIECERARLLELARGAGEDDIVYTQNELSEVLPSPTPLSRSFMELLWQAGGSTDLACRSFGFPYDVLEDGPPLFTTVYGALYINNREERRRLQQGPGMMAAFRLSRSAEEIESHFANEFLPDYLKRMRLNSALDFTQIKTKHLAELLKEWTTDFVESTYFVADRINIAADFYLKGAEKDLRAKGLSPAIYLGQMPQTVVYRALSMLPAVKSGKTPISEFLKFYGHRSLCDYELAMPRFSEKPELLDEFVEQSEKHIHGNAGESAPAVPDSSFLRIALDRAKRFQVLKEDGKHHALIQFGQIRRLIVELGRRFELGNDIFYLTLDEVYRMLGELSATHYRESIALRKREAEVFSKIELPSQVTLMQLESLQVRQGQVTIQAAQHQSGQVSGTLVAGAKEVEGVARVILDPAHIGTFREGEILVTRFTSPEWTPLFPKALGIVTEVGGWLSHAAILAREYNITAVVGARGAMQQIKDGDRIRLSLDGRVLVVASRELAARGDHAGAVP